MWLKQAEKGFSLLLSLIVIVLVCPKPTQAASIPQFQTFPGPLKATPPVNVVASPDGTIWFSLKNSTKVGRFNTKSKQIQKYDGACLGGCSIALDTANNLLTGYSGWFNVFSSQDGKMTHYIDPLATDSTFPQPEAQKMYPITRGADGNIWYVTEKTIGRVTTLGEMTDFSLPDEDSNGAINTLTAGSDGNLWFSTNNGHIGKITPLGEVSDYPLGGPGQESRPEKITKGPDQQLWFIDSANNTIQRFTMQGKITSYPLPSTTSAQNLSAMVAGPDGRMWLADKGNNQLLAMNLQGTFSAYQIPTTDSQPGDITFDSDGTLWFSETGANQLGQFTIPISDRQGKGQFTEFPIPGQKVDPWFILPGPKGDLWFSEEDTNKVGRITTSGQILQDYTTPSIYDHWGEAIGDMARGKDGNVWFAEGHDIERMTADGQVSTFSAPGTYGASSLTANTDGNIWFLTNDPRLGKKSEQIGKITPPGKITRLSFPDIPNINSPFGIAMQLTAGPGGTLWVTEPSINKIGRFTTEGQITEFTIPSAPSTNGPSYGYDNPPSSEPSSITWGPDGNIWFFEMNGNKLGRITPKGIFSEFPLSAPIGYVSHMVFGSDGNIWIALGNSIARVTQQGIVTLYPMKTYSIVAGITAGPDGNIWFTDQFRDEIGRIVLNKG